LPTKLISFLNEERKIYQARLVLGLSTDTQDLSGQVISAKTETQITGAHLAEALTAFTGEQEQTPPMYSALKVKGEPLYKLARAGKEIERAKRKITIYHLLTDEPLLPVYGFKEGPTLFIECSRGTYIRTLCHELGAYLGCGGCMGDLIRLASGPFRLREACTLQELMQAVSDQRLPELLISPADALAHLPLFPLSDVQAEQVRHGRKLVAIEDLLPPPGQRDQASLLSRGVSSDGRLVAILRYETGSSPYWQPVRVLT
jgi:tRNA pseudouridine55 synthase